MEHCKRKWQKYFMYSWKRNRKCSVSKLRKLERKIFHTYKMHFYLLITTWYTLTFMLSIQFVRHAFHLWFLLIFNDDVYRWQIPPPCLVSRQIILKLFIRTIRKYITLSVDLRLLVPSYIASNRKLKLEVRVHRTRLYLHLCLKDRANWPVALTGTFHIHEGMSTVQFRHDNQKILRSTRHFFVHLCRSDLFTIT